MQVYSVSQVNSYLKGILYQDPLLQDVWVNGEISDLAQPGSGHSYFMLRDGGSIIRCVMFRGGLGANLLSNGSSVIIHGYLSIYEARGDVQIIADIAQPDGTGELQLKLEQLRLKLENEGLFEPSRKRKFPLFPQRIGVVTSPSGAVWHDIQTVAKRRYPLVELILAPATVQGDTAPESIVNAIKSLDNLQYVDAIIVARGGGSLEDLWPFNNELVARAIFKSQTPVISGIGHETDMTIADMVADHRAPTPSAATELLLPDQVELYSRVQTSVQALTRTVSNHVVQKEESLNHSRLQLMHEVPDLDMLRLRVDDPLRASKALLYNQLKIQASRIEGIHMRLKTLSPPKTLKRGYAIVQNRNEVDIITKSSDIKPGDFVHVTLGSGGFEAKVTSIQPGGKM